jgi:hypothetical protein
MNQSRSTGEGAEDMRLDRLCALEKGLELWYYQTRYTKARQLLSPSIFQTYSHQARNQFDAFLSDADHATRNSHS